MRILHIIWWGEIGGVAFNLLDFINNSKGDGHRIDVCILNKTSSIIDSFKSSTTNIIEIGASSGMDVMAILRYFTLLRTGNYDIVHDHIGSFFVALGLMLYGKSIAKVFQEHGDIHQPFSVRKRRVFYRLFGFLYDKYLAISENTKDSMIKARVPIENIVVISNPVDTQRFNGAISRREAKNRLGVNADVKIIGTACRFSPEKDLDLFLRCVAIVHSVEKNVCFLLVGAGTEENNVRRLIVQYGLEDVVCLTGIRTDMPYVLRAFDIFLFTSLRESFGRVLLESQASKTPVVAASPIAGGSIEIIKNSPGIIGVDNRDPIRLSECLIRLLNSEEERNAIGHLGRQWVLERYNVDKWVNEILTTYMSITLDFGHF